MSASIDRPSPFSRIVLPGAFSLALVALVVEALPSELGGDVMMYGLLVGPVVLALGAIAAAWLLVSAVRDPERAVRLRREALLVPCVLAPLGVLAPWTLAPSHFGTSYGSLPFFLSWVDRYPTVGPVNHEVLLGIGAVLGACALPAALAAHVALTRRPRPRVVITLAILQLVAYLPVLLRLDGDLLLASAAVARGGEWTIAGPVAASWWQNALAGLAIGAGAMLRASATFVMLAFVPLSLRAREPVVVWETA
ncbi:MAG: hypothetical protein H6719_19160 [Sandaracinaceae bacterium]|nr:hypothetical protein [Sandaracinaceae bacterium]